MLAIEMSNEMIFWFECYFKPETQWDYDLHLEF